MTVIGRTGEAGNEHTQKSGSEDRENKTDKKRSGKGVGKPIKQGKWDGNRAVETANGKEMMGKTELVRAGDGCTSNSFTSSIPVRELSLLRPLQLCSALSPIPGLSNMPC